jgi:protein involved in ribonucleotide reduction
MENGLGTAKVEMCKESFGTSFAVKYITRKFVCPYLTKFEMKASEESREAISN